PSLIRGGASTDVGLFLGEPAAIVAPSISFVGTRLDQFTLLGWHGSPGCGVGPRHGPWASVAQRPRPVTSFVAASCQRPARAIRETGARGPDVSPLSDA